MSKVASTLLEAIPADGQKKQAVIVLDDN